MSEGEPTKLDKYDEAFDVVEKPFFALFRKTEKNAHRITFLTVVVAFDLLMFLCFGYVALRANHAVDTAERARLASAINQCESGNDFRRLDLQRWTYVLQISDKPDPDLTVAQQKKAQAQNDLFRKYIVKADALKDCQKFAREQVKLNK